MRLDDEDRYRVLLLRAGLTDEEIEFVIRKIRQDMAELFGTDKESATGLTAT